jgi:ligand-binding sensor domain-containing protein
MQYLIKTKLLLFFFLAFQLSFSQTFVSKHIDITNGLPSNNIRCIFKDSRGLLWIGTENGLSLFDGKKFKVFTVNEGLAGNDIWKIVEDKNNDLWMSCYGKGLSKFDGKKFINYNTSNGLVNNYIRTLYVNEANQLLIGTQDGMSIFEKNNFRNFNRPTSKKHNTPFQVMQFINKNNEDYVMTYRHGFFKYNKKQSLYLDSITTIGSAFKYIEYKKKYIYGTAFGLYSDSLESNFSNVKSLKHHLSEDIIWDFEHINDELYMASWGVNHTAGGVIKYDGKDVRNLNKSYNINSKEAWALFHDKESDVLWVGTIDNGLYLLDLTKKIQKYYPENFNLKETNIIDIEIVNDTKWVLCKNGLLKIENNKPTFFNSDYFKINENEFLTNNKVIKFNKLKLFNNNLYLSTNIGLYKLDVLGNIDNFIQMHLEEFVIDKYEQLLKPKPYDNLSVYSDAFSDTNPVVYKKEDAHTPLNVVDVATSNGKSFFASRSRGLHSFYNKKFISHFQDGSLKETNIQHLVLVNDDLLYIASISGNIYLADISSDFKIIKTFEKDKIHGNTISFLEYYKNYLIVGTNEGLNIIQENNVRFLNEEQGLKEHVFTSSKIKNDSLYIGTKNGLFSINLPKLLKNNSRILKIVIEDIKVNHKPYFTKEYNWLSLHKKNISLPHDKNIVDIKLKTNELYNPNKIKLFYKINDGDFVPIDNNIIYLTNLSSDTYNIAIKTIDEFYGTEKITSLLQLKINKPYWRTWWFWLVNGLLLALLVFLIYKYNVTKIKEKEALKSELNKRIAETKLEALQSQMNPHFTFNAMSSIQNYVIDNDIDKALMYIGEFSKLMRKTLDNSGETYITLQEEIEYLNTYILLENMRFDNAVDVCINHEGIVINEELIPPMLIQPLIENSFNHAFNKNHTNHQLTISFSKEKGLLKCIIADNGIGMQKSSKTPHHTSKAMGIIKERLSLISKIPTHELIEIKSSDCGTITTVYIPLNR